MREAVAVRRRRSQAEVGALVAEFEASGLMREAFCQQRGLAVGTLDKYRRRVHRGLRSSGDTLLPVEVVSLTAHDAAVATVLWWLSSEAVVGSKYVVDSMR